MNIVDEYLKQIDTIKERILNIQRECSHPDDAVDKDPKSDPAENSYWYNCYCKLCHKKWSEDQ